MNRNALIALGLLGLGFAAYRTAQAAYEPAPNYGDGSIPDTATPGYFPEWDWTIPDIFTYQTVNTMPTTIQYAYWKTNEYPAYASIIASAEDQYSIPRDLLARQLYQESRFRADIINCTTRSRANAVGIAQFTPIALIDYPHDPLNPSESIFAAARFMRDLFNRFQSWPQALAAYNWGQGNQSRDRVDGIIGNAWPLETRNYVSQITADVPVG